MGLDNERKGPMAILQRRNKGSVHIAARKPKAKKAKKKAKKKASKKKAKKKASKKRAKKPCKPAVTVLKASDIAKSAYRKNKRWACMGPVRSGCGGSRSKVVR
jgi:hypothetical protein